MYVIVKPTFFPGKIHQGETPRNSDSSLFNRDSVKKDGGKTKDDDGQTLLNIRTSILRTISFVDLLAERLNLQTKMNCRTVK